MSNKSKSEQYPKLRTFTEKHLKNLYNVQLEDNCQKIDSEIGKIKCNICGYESDLEFLHFGNRSNEQCPNCYSIKRTRMLWYYLENKTNLLKKDDIKVLHTAPESAIYKKLKEDFGDRYISSDIHESAYVDEIIDIQDIPYEDNTFDMIVTSHVLEHVPDDYKAIKEFYRVLKPNGTIVILIPLLFSLKKTFELPQINSPELRQRYYKQYDHRRYYSGDDFFRLLELIGFKTLKKDKYFLKKSEDIKLKYSLSGDPIFIGKKIVEDKKPITKDNSSCCSICNKDAGYIEKENNDMICSECNSTSYERLLYSQMEKYLSKTSELLYINPTEVLTEKIKETSKQVYTLPEENFSKNKIMKLFKKENKTSILNQLKSFSDSTFDMILTYHLLDQTINDKQLFEELSRVLKKGGKIFLKENIDLDLFHKIEDESINITKLRTMFYGNPNANRCYGLDFIDYLKDNRFTVEYDDPELQKDNLKLKDELIKDPLLICTKK